MKYEIKTERDQETFKPFRISIIIETYKEYVHFHDEVMGRLSIRGNGSQNFFGDIYQAGHMEINKAKGKID